MRFFSDEGKRYYINEIARLVNTTQGTCRRELNRLVDMGLLTTVREGNLQYYRINKQNPLLREFSSIVRKTIGIEASLRSVLGEIEGVTFAFIFGSYAKGRFGAESDIDLVVVGDVPEKKLLYPIKHIEKETGRLVNYHLFTEKEFRARLRKNSFLKSIVDNFLILKGNEGEFRKLLEKA